MCLGRSDWNYFKAALTRETAKILIFLGKKEGMPLAGIFKYPPSFG